MNGFDATFVLCAPTTQSKETLRARLRVLEDMRVQRGQVFNEACEEYIITQLLKLRPDQAVTMEILWDKFPRAMAPVAGFERIYHGYRREFGDVARRTVELALR